MGERLKTADRAAELLARHQVFAGQFGCAFHRAQRLGGEGDIGARDHGGQRGIASARPTQASGSRQCHAIQCHLGRAAAGKHRVTAHGQPRRVGGHQEQGNSVAVERTAAFAGGNDEIARRLGIDDHGLAAIDHHAVAVSLGRGFDARKIEPAGRFAMCKCKVQCAADHLFDKRDLADIAEFGQQSAAEQRGVEHGFDHACTAQLFEHGRDVKALAAKTALLFGEQRADHAKLGEAGPYIGAHPLVAVDDLVARFGVVLVRQIAPQGVLQHLPLFGQVEIHARQPPILTLAMIPRWISLDPPKIDSLRLLK